MRRFYSTVDLAERCKSLTGRDSYYSLSKLLDVTSTCVRSWYKLGTVMDDETGLKVSELLRLPPEQVLISLQMERIEKRHNDKLSSAWRKIAEKIAA